MKKLLVFTVLALFVACNSSADSNYSSHQKADSEIAMKDIHNATSTLTIEGMTCEIGCVRTIKSHLSKMAGVIDVKMNFDTSRAADYSTIEFDQNVITEADMKTEIESIAGGLYSVTDIKKTEK